jgi:hypothetical protein
MIVKTSVPIIYKCNCPPINSNFKLTTALPVIKNGVVVGNKIAANTLNYSSVNAKDKYVPKQTKLIKKKKKAKTSFGSKVKKFVGNLKDSGAVDFAKKLIDKKLAGNEPNSPPIDTPLPPVEEPKKGLSMGAKIGIGVGIAAVLGLSIYLMVKKK